MDLLGQETVKPQKSKGKKIVLILLAISIVLLIISLVLIYTLKSSVSKKLTLSVNDKESQISQTLLIQDETGKRYISMKEVAGLVAYDYFEGGYLESEENGNKAYIDTIEQIIEYEADSDQICKTEQDSSLGKEYYKLNNKIIKRNNSLYIALEDFNVGCNLVYMTSQNANTIMIYTNSYLISKYQKDLSGKKVDDSTNNQKALSYNMMIVSDENNKVGVMDLKKNLLIGYKY
jgi:flagellar basal body-associated protein FliL